jgi:lactoylglutathione lyase
LFNGDGFQNNKLKIMASNFTPTFNHIALHVSDLQKSTDFYNGILGLPVVVPPFTQGRHCWLSLGGSHTLHLIMDDEPQMEKYKIHHFCLSVPDINDAVALLKKHHIYFEDWHGMPNQIFVRRDGILQIYFTDPDGYWIEINNDCTV